MRQNRLGLLILAMVAGTLAGCADKPPVDMVATGEVDVRTTPGEKVELPPPSVLAHQGVVVISGVIQRKAEKNEPIAGHLTLTMLNEEGEQVASMPLAWRPKEIPTTGDRSAAYKVNCGWYLPKGTKIVITYFDTPDFASAPPHAASGGKGGGDGGAIRSPGAGERTGRGGGRR